MNILNPDYLNSLALIIGFLGSVVLAFSSKEGVISKNGTVIFNGLDPMSPVEENLNRVKSSHWRNRHLTPIGWFMLAGSFLLQLIATSLN